MVAKARVEGHVSEHVFVWLEELPLPVRIPRAGPPKAGYKTRQVAVDVVARGKDEPHGVAGSVPALVLLRHRAGHGVLGPAAVAVVANDEEDELIVVFGPSLNDA